MKRADFKADTAAGFWGKAESTRAPRLAHLWRQVDGVKLRSACGRLVLPIIIGTADHHTQRCKRCEASK